MKQPNVQLNTVLDDIKMGKTAHCYLIYGDEEYLVKDALHQIIDLLIPGEERNLNLFWMDGNSTDMDTICESILTPPLIPGKKVIVVNNTALFYSKASLPDVAKEIIGNIEREPRRAAKALVCSCRWLDGLLRSCRMMAGRKFPMTTGVKPWGKKPGQPEKNGFQR